MAFSFGQNVSVLRTEDRDLRVFFFVWPRKKAAPANFPFIRCSFIRDRYATRRLEDSGRQNDEINWRETMHSRSCATFFRHSAVLSLEAVLLRKISVFNMLTASL